jgi:RNA polymerase sigma factor (sigma-70 family)
VVLIEALDAAIAAEAAPPRKESRRRLHLVVVVRLTEDRSELDALVRRVGRIALPIAVAVLGDRDTGADVAQDVAVEVLRGLPRLREPEKFDAWVRRIAVRHAMRAARRRSRRAEVPLQEAVGSAAPADDVVVARDLVYSVLRGLPPRQRAALALKYVLGLSDREIAEALGCRPGTVASLLSRARKRLRAHHQLAEYAATGGL